MGHFFNITYQSVMIGSNWRCCKRTVLNSCLQGKQLVIHHLAPFDHLLRDTSLAVLEAIREAAQASENPLLFLQGKQGTTVCMCTFGAC